MIICCLVAVAHPMRQWHEYGAMVEGGTEEPREKLTPVPLHLPWISLEFTQDETWVSAVRSQYLAYWVIAQPGDTYQNEIQWTSSNFQHRYLKPFLPTQSNGLVKLTWVNMHTDRHPPPPNYLLVFCGKNIIMTMEEDKKYQLMKGR